jgi:hypothetical protein
MKYEYSINDGGIIQPDGDIIEDLEDAAEELTKLRIALADAIRRPMGTVPDSAAQNNLITAEELEAAEQRRPKSHPIMDQVRTLAGEKFPTF